MKKLYLPIGILLLAAGGIAAYRLSRSNDSGIHCSGTVEAHNIRVGSKVSGRVSAVLVREGDCVRAGQPLVEFDSAELEASLAEAKARVLAAEAAYDKMRRGYLPEEVEEARATAAQFRAMLDEAERGPRPEQIGAAEAERDRAEADAQNAKVTFDRFDQLWRADEISHQDYDNAKAHLDQAGAALRTAEQNLAELKNGTRREDIDSARARFVQASATERKLQRGYRAEDIQAARGDLAAARAQVSQLETRLKESQVLSPSEATVEVLDVRSGDLIAPNEPIATLLERNQLYVRVFVPETRIGQIALNERALLSVDSFPGKTFAATVEQINQEAEFLPRNVQTADERVHQVIGVKLRIDDSHDAIRAGMSANVVFQPTVR